MAQGVDIGFEPGGLREGVDQHEAVRGAAERLAAGLAGIVIDAAALGDVPGVAPFVGAATGARDAQTTGAGAEQQRRADLVGRVRQTAELGDLMVSLTTARAGDGALPIGGPADILRQPGG